MLTLSRKVGQRIVVPGLGVVLTVLEVRGGQVRLGIEAPKEVAVHRQEVWHVSQRQKSGQPDQA